MTLPDGSAESAQQGAVAEAVVWMAFMRGPQWNRAAELAHKRWLLASEVNAVAWKVATDVWEQEMAPTRERPTCSQSRVDSDRWRPMVERHSVSTRSPEKVAHEPTWSVEAGHGFHLLDPRQFFGVLKRLLPVVRTLALLALVIAGNPVGPTPEPANGLEFHRSTKVGQTETLVLEDDSRIHLNTDTSITIAEGPGRRDVVLERGEVFAEVRHDELKPFRIAVGHVVVEDLGTRLDVYTDDGKTRVTVIEGKVRILERRANGSMVDPFVASSEGFKREGAMLGVGDVVKVEEHDDGTAIVYKEPTDTAAAARNIQWLQGKLDFTGQSLAEVVHEINRYNSLRLVIDDPSIAGLRIGGRIDVGDPNAFVELLRARDRIRTTVITGDGGSVREIHLRGPPPPANSIPP